MREYPGDIAHIRFDDEFATIDVNEIMNVDSYDISEEHLDETIAGAIIIESGDIQLTWDGSQRYSDIYTAEAIIKITATRGIMGIDGNFYKAVLLGKQEWMAGLS